MSLIADDQIKVDGVEFLVRAYKHLVGYDENWVDS